jgi:mediator of RNA polymerase II transcription subunit 18
MSSHMYEVALFGEFFSRDLKAILNRVTLHSESSHPMHSREIIFEPLDAQRQREGGSEPVLLRAKKELGESGTGWNVFLFIRGRITQLTGFYDRALYSYLKPESVRAHPEATVRPWATCQVIGDALSFASALGYVYDHSC